MPKTTTKTKRRSTKSSAASRSGSGTKVRSIKNIDWFKKRLEKMRDDINNLLHKGKDEAESAGEVGDEGDVAVQSVQRDLFFELSGNERHILEEVEAALRRIEKGTYGICEGTGKPISLARLRAVPYARYCVEYQSRFEKG